MTRQEFIDTVNSFWELLDFCSDEDCHICEDVYDSDGRYDEIEESLVRWAHDYNWEGLLAKLREQESNNGYEYYYRDEYDDFIGLDGDDFERYKHDVLEWIDSNGYWPEDAEEDEDWFDEPEDPAAEIDPEDAVPTEQEDYTIAELFSAGVGCLRALSEEALRQAQEDERNFANLLF